MFRLLLKKICIFSGIDFHFDFSADSVNVTYPTLSLTSFEEEDQDYALVKKIGAGDKTFSDGLPLPSDSLGGETESLATVEKPQCVFHVAQQMSISMPVVGDNLEIRERGSTKIMLTSGSDEIDAHALRSELRFSKEKTRRGGRPPKQVADQEQEQFGPGWFNWRQWRVDQTLIQEFSDYIGKYRNKLLFSIFWIRIQIRMTPICIKWSKVCCQ
jgi:hypothetical protein